MKGPLFAFKNEKYVNELKKIPHKFSAIHNAENSTTEITIYGVIGDSWWEDSVSAKEIDDVLNAAGTNDIVINLNSPGGDAFDGISIYNRLKRHAGNIKIYVDGWACSAASIIAMAADELIMGAGSMLMIHEASTFAWGKKGDFLSTADMLAKLDDSIVDVYMTKTNKERNEVIQLLEAETWFTANEAVEMGFADEESKLVSNDPEPTPLNESQISSIVNQITEKVMNNLNKNKNQNDESNTPKAKSRFIF